MWHRAHLWAWFIHHPPQDYRLLIPPVHETKGATAAPLRKERQELNRIRQTPSPGDNNRGHLQKVRHEQQRSPVLLGVQWILRLHWPKHIIQIVQGWLPEEVFIGQIKGWKWWKQRRRNYFEWLEGVLPWGFEGDRQIGIVREYHIPMVGKSGLWQASCFNEVQNFRFEHTFLKTLRSEYSRHTSDRFRLKNKHSGHR